MTNFSLLLPFRIAHGSAPKQEQPPVDRYWVEYSVEACEAVGGILVRKIFDTITRHISCEISETYTFPSLSNTHMKAVITGRLTKRS